MRRIETILNTTDSKLIQQVSVDDDVIFVTTSSPGFRKTRKTKNHIFGKLLNTICSLNINENTYEKPMGHMFNKHILIQELTIVLIYILYFINSI